MSVLLSGIVPIHLMSYHSLSFYIIFSLSKKIIERERERSEVLRQLKHMQCAVTAASRREARSSGRVLKQRQMAQTAVER